MFRWHSIKKKTPPAYLTVLAQGPRGAVYLGRVLKDDPSKFKLYGGGTTYKTIKKWSELPPLENAFWKMTDTGEFVCSECGSYAASNMYNRHVVRDPFCRRCGRAMVVSEHE